MRSKIALLLTLASSPILQAQVSLTGLGTPYSQDFDSLAAAGTSSTVPAGWAFRETGTNAETTYGANNGSNNAGNTYSYGAADVLERAFGGLQSGSLVPTVGAAFTNNTGGTITSLTIGYTGEQWRLGTANRAIPDRIDFQYSLDATDLATGTWVDVDQLDFTGPTGATIGAKDGNAAAFRTVLGFTITGLNIAHGATFRIRWASFDASGADDGLAVDDFSITPNGTGVGTPSLSINDVSANETNSGTTNFVFTVSLSAPAPAGGVTFDIATAANTATAGSDYTTNSLTGQTISAGSSTYTFTVQVLGDVDVEPNETFFVNVTNMTGATAADVQGTGTIVNDDLPPVVITQIHAIQGSGISSPLVGQSVTTEGIVTAVRTNGFFLQTPDANVDGNPATSQGILVFTSSTPPATAVVGNLVRVAGTVTEFIPTADPKQRPVTEITSPTVTLVSSGQTLPALTVLNASVLTAGGGIDQLERFEGMRVSAASLTVVAPTDGIVSEVNATANSNGVFYSVLTGAATPVREAGIEVLDTPANPATACAAGAGCTLPIFDSNPERIRVDSDAITGQVRLDLNTGAVLTNVEGVLHYEFRTYSIFPTTAPIVGGTQVTAVSAPTPGPNAVTIAAMNVERLFDSVNDPGGDTVVTPTALDGRLNKISRAIRTLLKTPDVVALEEVENLATLQALAGRINSDATAAGDPDPGYIAFLVEGNDVGGIDVGFLTKPGITSSVTQLANSVTFLDPCTGAQSTTPLNDRPPFRLNGQATKGGNTLSFTVIVNHLRSLIDINDETPCTFSTNGGRVRAKRAAQANNLAQIVQDELTANPAAKIVLVGDFNAFEVNDGYVDSINAIMGTPAPNTQVMAATNDPTYPNMTNLVSLLPVAQRYSYVFDGNHQTLDHAILNPGAMAQFTGGGYVRVNSDFNETFRGDFNRPERYSDHDPVFVALTTAQNVTARMGIVRTGIIYNRAVLTATSTLRVTNNTGSTMSGTIEVVITGLPDGVRLTNATSTSPASAIYSLASPIAAGQTVIVPLAFAMNAVKAINYNVAAFHGGSIPQ